MRHSGRINSIAFSSDGTQLLTASGNKASLWEVKGGDLIGRPLIHPGVVWSAEFSPDGQKIVTACFDGVARVWDKQTMTLSGKELRHRNVIVSAKFSQDGRWILTSSLDKTAVVWDPETGHQISDQLFHRESVKNAVFGSCGERVLTFSENGSVKIWNVGLAFAGYPPKWLPGLAAAVAGYDFDQQDRLFVSDTRNKLLEEIRETIAVDNQPGFWSRWGERVIGENLAVEKGL
jgi:WD40 repeat protein